MPFCPLQAEWRRRRRRRGIRVGISPKRKANNPERGSDLMTDTPPDGECLTENTRMMCSDFQKPGSKG